MWIALLTKLPYLAKVLPYLKSWKVVLGIVLVVALGANWLYISHLHSEVDDLTEAKAMLTRTLDECIRANGKNMTTIGELRDANEALAQSVVSSEEERIAAIRAAAERERRAALQLDNTLDEIERLRNANPTCDQLSKIDIGAACPAVVDRLREHAAGPNPFD